MKYKIQLLLILVLGFNYYQLEAQEYHENISKAFKIDRSTTVDISNKYGKVHVVNWAKDSVKFDISIRVNSSKPARVEKLKQSIKILFMPTEYYIVAKTDIVEKNSYFSDLISMAESFIPQDDEVIIDYTVMVPSYANLKISNKFGDIYADNLQGNVSIVLSYGDLKINDLGGKSNVKITSGDGVINSVNDGIFEISYSDLYIKKTSKLSIDSRSAKVNIDDAVWLKIVSKRDKYYIQKASEIFGDTYFTTTNVSQLVKNLKLVMKYGSANIYSVEPGFSYININMEYADVELMFDKETSFEFDITRSKDVNLQYPIDLAHVQKKPVGEDGTLELLYGQVGKGTNSSKVQIDAPKDGTITLFSK